MICSNVCWYVVPRGYISISLHHENTGFMCLYSMLLMLNMVQHRMMNDKHMMCSDHVDMFQEIVDTICIMRMQYSHL